MKFTSDFIEQVREANDIAAVISEYVPLKRRGRNFWACCPFHNEKTASFSVAPDKGFFYCFGCHESGDVFSFVMKKDNLTFSEAVTKLAERANIALPVIEKSEEDKVRERKMAELYNVNEMACNFFHNCLTKTHYGKTGLEYFHNRHLSDETITSFSLGYAPNEWSKLTDAFIKKGIRPGLLVQLGLAKEKNGHYYDTFRNRVIFPIFDGRSRVVGFGGRVLDDSKPKYLNSPETIIFNKRKLLFAMDKASKAIYTEGHAILVEGYMDVIAAHNSGIKNVVASLGTAFTAEQARLLQRQAKELVLSYDMDSAGRNATLRAMEIVRGLGMQIRVITLPQGKDPDEYINKVGPDAYKQAIDDAPDVLAYMLQTALSQNDPATLVGKAAITAMVIPVVATFDNQVILEGSLEKIARSIKIDVNAVRSEFNKYVLQHPELNQQTVHLSTEISKTNEGARGDEKMAVAEENILRYLVNRPASFEKIHTHIEPSFFMNSLRRTIYDKLAETYKEKGMYAIIDIQQKLAPEEANELARIMVLQDVPMDETVLLDYVKRFRHNALQKMYEEHSRRAAELSKNHDDKFIDELAECKKIKEQMKQLS